MKKKTRVRTRTHFCFESKESKEPTFRVALDKATDPVEVPLDDLPPLIVIVETVEPEPEGLDEFDVPSLSLGKEPIAAAPGDP